MPKIFPSPSLRKRGIPSFSKEGEGGLNLLKEKNKSLLGSRFIRFLRS